MQYICMYINYYLMVRETIFLTKDMGPMQIILGNTLVSNNTSLYICGDTKVAHYKDMWGH